MPNHLIMDFHRYQQYGSIPVALYDGNLTFPNGFDLSRSYLSHRTVSSNGSVVSVQVSKPIAGTWFTAAFIEIRDSQTVKKVKILLHRTTSIFLRIIIQKEYSSA